MLIRDAGGEFALIRKIISSMPQGDNVLLPIGHDAAVVTIPSGRVVLTTDTVVEGTHFDRRYFTPEQIGIRAIEGATSDIIAVGGVPKFALCSLVLNDEIEVEFVEGVYRGIALSLLRLGMALIGGDTSSGVGPFAISCTVVGESLSGERIISRAGASPGDLILVSGGLGGSAAGLALWQSQTPGFDQVKRFHTEPKCRLEMRAEIVQYATSAIDISDGLSSEIGHLCEASHCGAEIDIDKIPLKAGVEAIATMMQGDALEWALHGGEEYEILYTVAPVDLPHCGGVVIGEMRSSSGVTIREGSTTRPLQSSGFNHFRAR